MKREEKQTDKCYYCSQNIKPGQKMVNVAINHISNQMHKSCFKIFRGLDKYVRVFGVCRKELR